MPTLASLALLVASAGATDPSPPPEEPPPTTSERRIRWSALPNASYDSDDKLGFGARGQLDVLRDGYEPYRASYVVHLFATTNGYHHHRFRFDLVGLGPEGDLRLTGHLALRAWLNDGYWGIGNGTIREATREEGIDPADPAAKFYRYSLVQPFSNLTARAGLGGPWSAFGSAQARWSVVGVYPGSLLEAEAPYGADGGLAVQLGGGVLYDTRVPEVTPDQGLLLEASARGVVGTQGPPFGGPFLSGRGYVLLVPRVVYAARVMGEYLAGEVPFYEMVHWGGFVPIAGFGGADTLRGQPFGRWRAPGKLVLNNELRLDVGTFPLLREPLRVQLIPLADVGLVFGAGDDASAPPPPNPLHPTAGLGVRAIWATTLVGRLDVAFGEDWIREADGSVHTTENLGFYLVFDHTF